MGIISVRQNCHSICRLQGEGSRRTRKKYPDAGTGRSSHTQKRYPYNSGTLCELLNENVSYRALNTLFANEKIAAYKGGERMGAASD